MNDHMTLAAIANSIGVSLETIRSYAERFAHYLPAVRNGAELTYPPESVTLLGEIEQAVAVGATFDEIEAGLQLHLPRMVIAAQPAVDELSTSSLTEAGMARLLAAQRDQIGQMIVGLQRSIERAATTEQFHGLRDETASLAAALVQRDIQLEHANTMIIAELRQALGLLHREIVSLREELGQVRGGTLHQSAPAADETPTAQPEPTATTKANPEPEREGRQRTPRRMGQPLRTTGPNGSNGASSSNGIAPH